MQFVKTNDLKPGMRLAKPIYNRNGVLLYDRESKLTAPSIHSIHNFGLIGVYILEPAEPAPPLTKEDLEFEQNQTVYIFKLQTIVRQIISRENPDSLPDLIDDIILKYGSLNRRVNFNQNLRSSDDFQYKHAISTSILASMISSCLPLPELHREVLVCAALLYNYGYRNVPLNIREKGNQLDSEDQDIVHSFLKRGLNVLAYYKDDYSFFPNALNLIQYYLNLTHTGESDMSRPNMDLLASILHVAATFDKLTSMNLGQTPMSEIMAMQHLQEDPEQYSPAIVATLAQCIHIAPNAATVDLSTGEKGIILEENPTDYRRPLLLCLSNHKLYDLSDPEVYDKIQIVDIMKTMDNRIAVDEQTFTHFVADERILEITRKFREHKKAIEARGETL